VTEAPAELTDDTLLGGRVRLMQRRDGHRAGTDAVLLAAAVEPSEGEVAVDLGAGAGAVGLMIAVRAPRVSVLLVERDSELVELCRRNIELNAAGDRVRVIEVDVLAPARLRRARGLHPASADMVLTNPPFLEEGRTRASPDARRAVAHHLPQDGLDRWIACCADVLKPKGSIALIHRPDRLRDCLDSLRRRFGSIALRAIHPHAAAPAVRVVITGVKGSRGPLRMLPALVLHGADGRFTAEAEAVHRGERLLA
jgi:tRNA1(Val) A37 N6-methylase TrmN6